jgi:tetratricopeptide (TPR) repeat protein
MGERWDNQTGEPTAQSPAIRRADREAAWPPAPDTRDAPTMVDGHGANVPERSPYPTEQGFPGAYPLEPYRGYGAAPYLGYPGAQPPDEPSALAQPFPIWLTLAAPLVMLATLALAYGAEVYLLGADWATGALAAALAAFALAALTVIVLIVRVIAGRRAFGTVALAALLALTLVGGGLGGVSQINPLRRAQAQRLESARQWQAAINEYAQSGENAPNAPDIARIYTEWGEALAGGGDYAGAASKLATVTQTYAQSGTYVARARADLYNTYVTWIRSGATTLPFQQSLAFLASYASDPACDTTCQQTIKDVSGQAHFQYGEQLLKANQYKQAITEFELVQAQYATSAYAGQAHAAAAQAYLALGQQTLAQDCASAVPYYETLAKTYGDTNEGKQAKAKLAAGVKVSGVISGAPGKPAPTVFLSLHVAPSRYYASGEYKTSLSLPSGKYSFNSVKPGVYYLTTLRTTSTQIVYTWYNGSDNKPYGIQVGPMCATDLGALKY